MVESSCGLTFWWHENTPRPQFWVWLGLESMFMKCFFLSKWPHSPGVPDPVAAWLYGSDARRGNEHCRVMMFTSAEWLPARHVAARWIRSSRNPAWWWRSTWWLWDVLWISLRFAAVLSFLQTSFMCWLLNSCSCVWGGLLCGDEVCSVGSVLKTRYKNIWTFETSSGQESASDRVPPPMATSWDHLC